MSMGKKRGVMDGWEEDRKEGETGRRGGREIAVGMSNK